MDRPELTHALAVAGQVAESVFQDVNVVENHVEEGLTRHDALLGRGAPSIRNAGNVLQREFIRIICIFHLYKTLLDGEKLLFARRVTDLFLHQGRFVEKDDAGNWRDAPYDVCVAKTQTLLRDYTLKERERRRSAQPIVPVQQPTASVQQPILPVVQPIARPVSPLALPLIDDELRRFLVEPLDDPGMPDFIDDLLVVDMDT